MDENSPPGSLVPRPRFRQHYGPQGVAQGFNDFLDGDLHGHVHVAIGNRRGMGPVPWAANDPIFWLHHCNIDRLWASWNCAGRRNPTDAAWLTPPSLSRTRTAGQVVAVVRDFGTTSARGYTYDQFEPVPGAQPVSEAIMSDEAGGEHDRRPMPVASAPRSARPGRHLARHRSADGHLGPQVAPSSPTRSKHSATSAGSISLSATIGPKRSRAFSITSISLCRRVRQIRIAKATTWARWTSSTPSRIPAIRRAMTGKTKSFDVTDVVRKLHAEGRTGTAPSVTIVSAGRHPRRQSRDRRYQAGRARAAPLVGWASRDAIPPAAAPSTRAAATSAGRDGHPRGQRVEDGVDRRRQRTGNAGFAGAFHAQRIGGAWHH